MRVPSAYLDGAAMIVFVVTVVLTIVYMLDYAGMISIVPSYLR